jgi:hypothetical protein
VVTVNEIIILVNVVLEAVPPDTCPAGDANGDGRTMIDDVLAAVAHLLIGCPAG